MTPTHNRLIIVGPNSVRVQGDFGGGYTGPFEQGNQKARDAAIMRAVVYLPGAEIVGITEDERERLNLAAVTEEKPGTKTITIRIPSELAQAIERVAVSEDRSINAQLVRVIREWLAIAAISNSLKEPKPE